MDPRRRFDIRRRGKRVSRRVGPSTFARPWQWTNRQSSSGSLRSHAAGEILGHDGPVTVERRAGSKGARTRTAILDAAEQIMSEGGYAAVTSRSVASRVGVNAGLIHYYFPTIDDLFVALIDRGADVNTQRLARALASSKPLEALWKLNSDRRGVSVLDELMAATHHRPALREQVTAQAERLRGVELAALAELLPQYGIDVERFPPALVAATLQGVALLLARQGNLGVSTGRNDAIAAAEAAIADLEAARHTSGHS